MSIEMAVRLGSPATGGSAVSSGARVGSTPGDDDSSAEFTSALAGAEAASDAQSSRSAQDNQAGQSDKQAVSPDASGLPLATASPDLHLNVDPLVTSKDLELAPGEFPNVALMTNVGSSESGLVPLQGEVPVGLGGSEVMGTQPEAVLGSVPDISTGLASDGSRVLSAVKPETGGVINGLAFNRGEVAARPELVPEAGKASLTPDQDINALRLKLAADPDVGDSGDVAAATLAIELGDARANVRSMQEIRHQEDAVPLRPLMGSLIAPLAESAFRREFKSEKSIFRSDGVVQGDTFNFAKTELGMVRLGGSAGETQTASSGYTPPQNDAGKYWISGDLKNAELKLDGLGDSPVEVSISMTGKEAHVTFRSDESQTRAMLENANSELKELLGKEGLQLSGVSVGAKGSGDSGTSDQRPRHVFRPASDLKEFTDRVEATGRWAPGAGQAIDLFV